jgi:glyoxylase-like metal-dependent hydrolase (beta-lactamase superfamily II)
MTTGSYAPPRVAVERFAASQPGAWSNSYLISDADDALLFDVFQLRSDARQLADTVEASGKRITKVWISHAHPDHFMQLDLIVDRFPDAEVLTTPNVLEDLRADGPWMFDLLEGKLGPEAAERLVEPTAIDGSILPLGGLPRSRRVWLGRGQTPRLPSSSGPASVRDLGPHLQRSASVPPGAQPGRVARAA